MRYTKYCWDGLPGGERNDWGKSWWYFETDPDGGVVRQMEVYDSGIRLRYSSSHLEDEYGRLCDVNESEFDRSPDQELTPTEFETVWSTGPWSNEP